MRVFTALAPLALSSVVASQLIYLPFRNPLNSPQQPPPADQKPLNMAGSDPSTSSSSDPRPQGAEGTVILSDVMSRDKSINIFAGFTQDIESASRRLDDSTKNTTVLAPLNSAVEALPRKPWEDPRDYGELGSDAYEGDDGQERATRNLRRFVEAHMVPQSPWEENNKARAIGDDRDVWWETVDGVRYLQPGNIEVVSVASTVANGEVWIIKEVRNYA